ncbi:CoA ester lyase [Lentibacillus kapialis]|uniref:CoA ester lyase n=1 Tax=Lentibacillus kapialis TaxID=340214 RepID=A0A917PYT6_9BACI|nr:CoA ester lyase [Lentibacillus kapialis]GGJ99213.1 CoA ester lyase [Lentibacillus kapialis]
MSLFRTFLFVPGSNYRWFNKLSNYNADNIILDLEDSVPIGKKSEARWHVANSISKLSENQQVYVRVNKEGLSYSNEDLKVVIQKNLTGIVLPKINGPEDIEQLSEQMAEIEKQKNLRVGKISLLPILETARSMYFAYEIAIQKRIVAIAGLTAKDGDVQRAINYQWTPGGLETLYHRSKVVLAARAANKIPIGGLWQDVHNLNGLKNSASFNRQLGFDGEMVLHPSNISVVNKIYSPSQDEIAYYREMIHEFEQAEKAGMNSIIYNGSHIDGAHIKTARRILKYMDKINYQKEDKGGEIL